MTETPKRSAHPTFRRFFVRGLAVLLPSILTLWLVVYAYQFVEGFIAEPINRSLRIGIANVARLDGPIKRQFEPSQQDIDREIERQRAFRRAEPRRDAVRATLRQRNVNVWWRERWWMDFIGFAVAIVGVYVVGRLVGGYLGRRLYGRFENVVSAVPILRYIYTSVKQVVDFLISDDRSMQFSRVVAVQYPRKGIWSIGLLTGNAMSHMAHLGRVAAASNPDDGRRNDDDCDDSVTVFVPSSPTPFTGYTVTVPRREVHELPISIDEALRFVVSGGVLHPNRTIPPADAAAAPVAPVLMATGADAAMTAKRAEDGDVGKSGGANATESDERPKIEGPTDSATIGRTDTRPPLRNGPDDG